MKGAMRKMNKRFDEICSKYNVNVDGYIEYVDSSTQEGEEYSKRRVECNYKSTYGCTRTDCPYWLNMPEVIRA